MLQHKALKRLFICKESSEMNRSVSRQSKSERWRTMTTNSKSKFWNSILSIAEWKTKRAAKKKPRRGSGIKKWRHPGNSTPQRPQFSLERARARASARPRFFSIFLRFGKMMRRFVSVAPTGDIHRALSPSTRACIPPCTGKFKSTNSVQQFYCNEKNGRRGSAARQIRRRLNIKWDMTGALFLFRFHVLAPLWCVWARKSFVRFFFLSPFRREARRIVIGSDQT